MSDQHFGDLRGRSEQHAQHRSRKSGCMEQFGKTQSDQRRLFGRLEDDGCSGGNGRPQLVGHLVQWMVERSDGHRAAQRFPRSENFACLALCGNIARENLTVIAQGLHGGEAENIHRPSNFIARFSQRQTGLGGDDACELLTPTFERAPGLLQNLGPLEAGGGVPERCGCGDRFQGVLA